MSEEVRFGVGDYIAIALFLGISLGIGLYYGVIKKQHTIEHYLYGNRKMHLLPVASSLLVTYQSATSCLGIPAEVYTYSTMVFYQLVGIMLALVLTAFAIVPLLYPLKLNSAYEYLGRRFNSRSVQLLATFIGMLQTLMYISVVLFSPALALEAVAGIPLWASIIVVGVMGTLYTSLGGFRSVVWTHVFQFVILYGGLIVMLSLGWQNVGSFGEIFDLAKKGNRLQFSASFDPWVRHSLWTCVIGGMFTWLPNCCNQTAIQRIISLRNQRDAKIAVLLNVPFTFIFGSILIMMGLVLYAYYIVHQCGPLEAGLIENSNQLFPYFVIRVFDDVPVLAGLFMTVLFSGALSSVSSGINALAANTLQDVFINRLEKVSQAKKTLLAKLTGFGYGAVAIGIAYSMEYISGPVTQVATTAMGACGGPYFGMFCLGAIFPQANWIGALVGGVMGIIFNVWLSVSATLHAHPATRSPPITTSGCIPYPNISLIHGVTFPSNSSYHNRYTSYTESLLEFHLNSTTTLVSSSYSTTDLELMSTAATTESSDILSVATQQISWDTGHIHLYDVSYLYFGLTGFLVSLITGMIASLCSGKYNGNTDPIYIFPWLRRFWKFRYTTRKASYILTENRRSSRRLSAEGGGPSETTPIRALEFSELEHDTL